MKQKKNWGFQCRKKYSWWCGKKKFNFATLKGPYGYCKSHNFVYNQDEEEKKLYNGQPCIYTDDRYSGGFDLYMKADLIWSRYKSLSIKQMKNKLSSIRNIPEGAVIHLESAWYLRGLGDKLQYHLKAHYIPFNPDYKVNLPEYSALPKDEWCRSFTVNLRNAGYLVAVYEDDTEYCIAYGWNKKLGFSPLGQPVAGYHHGLESILFDEYQCFDKWSKCEEISMNAPQEDIILYLQKPYKYGED